MAASALRADSTLSPILIVSGTERPNTTEHNVPIILDVKGPISLHFQNRTSQYLSHSEWNRTSLYHWTQWPNTSWCQGSDFSPFSEQNVPIFRSLRVEHNVPILLLVMGIISLSDLWTHHPEKCLKFFKFGLAHVMSYINCSCEHSSIWTLSWYTFIHIWCVHG